MCEEIQQVEEEIAKLKEKETTDLTPAQRMVQSWKSKKMQIQLQRLHEDETKFMKVTQPWHDELANIAQKLEPKLADFKET